MFFCCHVYCNRRPYNLYCVGGDVKPCSINQCIVKNSVCFSLLVKYSMSDSVETWKGYLYAILMLLTAIGNSLLQHMMFKLSFDVGCRAKSGIISMVYKKVWMMIIPSSALLSFYQ